MFFGCLLLRLFLRGPPSTNFTHTQTFSALSPPLSQPTLSSPSFLFPSFSSSRVLNSRAHLHPILILDALFPLYGCRHREAEPQNLPKKKHHKKGGMNRVHFPVPLCPSCVPSSPSIDQTTLHAISHRPLELSLSLFFSRFAVGSFFKLCCSPIVSLAWGLSLSAAAR